MHYIAFIDEFLEERHALIPNCSVNSTFDQLSAQCLYPDNSPTIGILVIAQRTDRNELRKLYNRVSMNLITKVNILVEENGMYKVTIFSLGEGIGILNSFAEFTMNVNVSSVNSFAMGKKMHLPYMDVKLVSGCI